MTQKDYSSYKQFTEVYFSNEAERLIQQGWELTDILQRGSVQDSEGATVVYILGSKEDKPADSSSTPQPVVLDYNAGEDL